MSESQISGHLALPASGEGPPVLLLHAWWGLNDTMRHFATRLASAGFVVFAPDLYHGQVTDEIVVAENLSNALDAERARADIAAGIRFLNRLAGEARGVAVIGFSLGAYFALERSATHPEEVHSVVVYYGTGNADFSNSRAAYLGHFGEDDPYEPAEWVDALEETLRSAGRPVTFHRYPGAGHWFAEPDRPGAHDPIADGQAWERTLAFLRRTVDGG